MNTKICKNCLLFNREKKECKAAIIVNGEKIHMPVFPEDQCHMEELGIEAEQIRWWVENDQGEQSEKGKVKIEYPENFFGNKP